MKPQPLYRVHARCPRDPLARELAGGPPAFHEVSEPMKLRDAEMLQLAWIKRVTSRAWVITVEAEPC